MFNNYFISAIRNMIRNRVQTLIQVISLTIGITAAILIGLYAWYECTYDRYNEKADRIYRLQYGDRVGLPSAVGHEIKEQIPEVENVVRIVNWRGKDGYMLFYDYPEGDTTGNKIVRKQEDRLECDSTIFDIFSFEFIQGDPNTALMDPNSVVLSESEAKRIFGNKDPMAEPWGNLTVTGIIKDVTHSHLEIKYLFPLSAYRTQEMQNSGGDVLNSYSGYNGFMTYLLLPEGRDPEWVEQRINAYFKERWRAAFDFEEETEFSLLPLKDIYFSTGWDWEMNYCRHGNLGMIKVLGAVALLILLLGIINYINLTTARASLRAREVGIRNVVGASRPRLISQFLTEAMVLTLLAVLIALTLIQLILPWFRNLAGTPLDPEFLHHPLIWVLFIVAILILGLLSGIYPALYLTGFKIRSILSGDQVYGRLSGQFRKLLLAFQYTIAGILIIAILVIFRQLHYMENADEGFNKELVVSGNIVPAQYDVEKRKEFRQRLLQHPDISAVAFSSNMMGQEQHMNSMELNGVEKPIGTMGVSPGFFDLMQIELLEGRDFSYDRPADLFIDGQTNTIRRFVVNETFVKEFGLEAPLETIITTYGPMPIEIIGVVKDFNFSSLHERILPMIFTWQTYEPKVGIRISDKHVQATIEYIHETFNDVMGPWVVFDGNFLDEQYDRQYLNDEKTAEIIVIFAVIALLIACLGLFGLSSFMAARRVKEIGIRKVFGASERSLFALLASEFLKWVGVSLAIACPAGWIIMHRWLENFAYRTTVSWWIFAVTILIALLITFSTVTWQSLKTARSNPVDALRYE
jgi:putative ABC transport system permease protein